MRNTIATATKATCKALATALVAAALFACGGGGDDTPSTPQAPANGTTNITKELDLMSYGFEALDAQGNLVARADAPTLHFLGAATYVSWTNDSTNGFLSHVYEVSSPGGAPLPVVRVIPGENLFHKVYSLEHIGGGTYRFKVMSNASPQSLQVYAFGALASSTPADTFGIQVYAPNGTVTFDTTRKPLLVDAVVALPPSSSNAGDGTLGAQIDSTAVSGLAAMSAPGVVARGLGIRVAELDGNPSSFRIYATCIRVGLGSVDRVVGPLVANTDPQGGVTAVTTSIKAEPVFIINLARYL